MYCKKQDEIGNLFRLIMQRKELTSAMPNQIEEKILYRQD